MNKNEYIEFIIPTKNQFEALEKIFYLIKITHNNSEDYEIENFTSIVPEYVPDFFSTENQPDGWSLENIISFLIVDLDVTYLSISKKQNNTGRLDFDSNGYPYGGTNTLILFLKAFNMIPYEVDDGVDVDLINWVSRFEYVLESKTK